MLVECSAFEVSGLYTIDSSGSLTVPRLQKSSLDTVKLLLANEAVNQRTLNEYAIVIQYLNVQIHFVP